MEGDSPLSYLNSSKISKISHLRVLNFKSFSEAHFVGPFLGLSAVIGPNGGGKSNIIDAICFALCVPLKHLRCRDYKDLIHKGSAGKVKSKKSASVTIAFEMENGSIEEFTREIDEKHETRIIHKSCNISNTEYLNFLRASGIYPENHNFLVLQGEAESMATKSPTELTEFFEEISGSAAVKVRYEELRGRIAEVKEAIKDSSSFINGLKNERRKARVEKQNAESYQTLLSELELLELKFVLLNLLEFDLAIASDHKDSQTTAKALSEISSKRSQLTICLQKKNLQIRELRANAKEESKKVAEKKAEVMKARAEVSKFSEEIDYLEVNEKAKEMALARLQTDLQAKLKIKGELEVSCEEITKKLNSTPEFFDESTSAIFPLKEDLLRVSASISTLAMAIDSSERLEREQTQSHQSQELKVRELEERRKEAQNSVKKIEKELKGLRLVQVNLQSELNSKRGNFMSNKKAKEEQAQVLSSLTLTLAEHLEDKEFAELNSDFTKSVLGFHGELAGLIRPTSGKYEGPLKLALGGAVHYLVVENEEAARTIAGLLKEKGLQRDVLVLENIPDKELERDASNLRAGLKGLGVLAFDCLDFERSIAGLEKALMFLTKGKAFCDDFGKAERMRGIQGLHHIITIDGNVVKKGQLIAYGNIDAINRRTRFSKEIGGKQKLEKEILKAKIKLEEIEAGLKLNNGSTEESEISEISRKISELESEKSALETTITSLASREAEIQGKIDISTSKVQRFQAEQAVLHKKLEEANASKARLEEKAESILGKSFQWSRLEEFHQSKSRLQRIHDEISHLRIDSLTKAISEITESQIGLKAAISNAIESKSKNTKDLEICLSSLASATSAFEKSSKEVANAVEAEDKDKTSFERLLEESQNLEKESLLMKLRISERLSKKNSLFEEARMKGEAIKSQLKPNSFEPTIPESTLFIDYSCLDTSNIKSVGDIEGLRRTLQEEIREKAQKLDELSSSLSSSLLDKRLNSLNDRLSEKTKELENFQKEETSLTSEFGEIKASRVSAFMKVFEPVSFGIDSVYKALTKDEGNMDLGGSAMLFLENTAEPFAGGVLYSPTPSSKRFVYDVEQLSGGEKTIAGLALLFAVSKVCGQRILVFDEVDAFLDNENTRKYLSYIAQNHNFNGIQSLVVTHKSTIYENVDSLVGVAIHAKKGSQAYSLDLREEIQV